MTNLFGHLFNPAHSRQSTATATGLPELRGGRVNAGGGARVGVHDPVKLGNVATFLTRLFGGTQPADEAAGDWPPPSDCWPADVLSEAAVFERAALLLNRGGMAIGPQGVREVEAMLRVVRSEAAIHVRNLADSRARLSPGKLRNNTDTPGDAA